MLHLVAVLCGTLLHFHGSVLVFGYPSEVWSPAEVTSLRTRSPDSTNLRVRVNTFGKTHDLELFRAASVFSPHLEEYVTKVDQDGYHVIQKLVTTRADQDELESNLYTDADGSASLLVRERGGHLVLDGILNDNIHITEDVRGVRSDDGSILHIAYKRTISSNRDCRAVVPNETLPFQPPPMEEAVQPPPMQEIALETRQLPSVVKPELFLVIEYGFSAYFGHNLNAIKQYLAVFYNSVNRRYDMIKSPKIQNVITGILQVTSSSTETFKVTGSGTILDASKTLDTFSKWTYTQNKTGAIKTNYDVGLWMTSLDLGSASGTDGSYSSSTAGIAYIGSACQATSDRFYKVGLAEDKPGFYSGILNVAHELAHLLGAAHDGDSVNSPRGSPGATSCPWSDGYIMSYVFGTEKKMNFSPCSANQFKYLLSTSSGACLLNAPTSTVVTLNPTLPGTLIDLDTQCRSLYGSDYYFYTPYMNEVCVKRWCGRKVSSTSISLTTSGPALEGSFCDTAKTKVCLNGLCATKP